VLLALAIAGLFFLPDSLGVVLLVIAAFVEVFEVFLWIKFLRRYRVTTGAEGMVGERAEAIVALQPEGKVRLRGEIWNARATEPVADGAPVRVKTVDGLTLVVEPDPRG
jgi:membrane-bound serine protease (ClpP class)